MVPFKLGLSLLFLLQIIKNVSVAKKMFDAKVLIKRLPSFSVPKITVIRQLKPILKLQ